MWFLKKGVNQADFNSIVNLFFASVYVHHEWGTPAKESLYVMCNNLEDVLSLKQNTKVTEAQSHRVTGSQGKVRLHRQRIPQPKHQLLWSTGGSFISGSFTDMAWAEDCAGRATVCPPRSMSFTTFILPLDMKGLFGMAQVIGAKSLGLVLLTERNIQWDAPSPELTDQEMEKWSLHAPPHWSDVPLAIAYQTKASEDSSDTPSSSRSQVVHRMRLILVRLCDCPSSVLRYYEMILTAIRERSFAGSFAISKQTVVEPSITMLSFGVMHLTKSRPRPSSSCRHIFPLAC